MIMVSSILTGTYSMFLERSAALTGSDFKAGRIIDDGIFFDGRGLSRNDIQAFLNAKVPYCDTNGSIMRGNTTRAAHGTASGYPPPYTCLKDFRQETPSKAVETGICNGFSGGNKSAADIIHEVGLSCGINQKVLLVLLEKEQSLITDDWPWSVQYRSATGYGCPDTAPCDAEYYGFFNQVYNAARQFKRYQKNETNYRYRAGRTNFIQYNPNSSCGGTNVYIENQATAGLYNYTPYQPNPSAIANLNGAGDSCGAYGNRNFWKLYNDWFGSTSYSFGNKPSNQSVYAKAPCTAPFYDSTWVGRLYNPDTADYLFTTNRTEACVAISYGYIWDDLVMQNIPASDADAVPVYRIVNYSGHLYTTDIGVRDNYINNFSYTNEGIAFYGYSTAKANTLPVSLLSNGKGSFFLTSAGKEVQYFGENYGYFSYGTTLFTPNLSSTTSVLRLSRNNQRFYTTNPLERDQAIRTYGFQDEGTVSLNDLKPSSINTPIYRLRSPEGAFFYTTSRLERDAAVINYNYISEGTAFYALLYSEKPVYRASNYTANLKVFTNSRVEYDLAQQKYGFVGEGIGWYSY